MFWFHKSAEETENVLIDYGKWADQLSFLNSNHNNIATKIRNFAIEIGRDDFDRYFVAEPLIDFAIVSGITDKSADYIYRHFVYHKINMVEPIDIEHTEMCDLYEEFQLIPEYKMCSRRDI